MCLVVLLEHDLVAKFTVALHFVESAEFGVLFQLVVVDHFLTPFLLVVTPELVSLEVFEEQFVYLLGLVNLPTDAAVSYFQTILETLLAIEVVTVLAGFWVQNNSLAAHAQNVVFEFLVLQNDSLSEQLRLGFVKHAVNRKPSSIAGTKN